MSTEQQPKPEAPWMREALAELGVTEQAGSTHNPRVLAYHATTTLGAKDDETPWCSAFANWCMAQAGIKGTKSAAARSWASWGRALAEPRYGCVVVFQRPEAGAGAGHVAFYVDTTATGKLAVLGGNQGNAVRVALYSAGDVIAYRWPATP